MVEGVGQECYLLEPWITNKKNQIQDYKVNSKAVLLIISHTFTSYLLGVRAQILNEESSSNTHFNGGEWGSTITHRITW